MRLEAMQEALREEGLDGWLFYDHHERDPLAYRVLRFRPPQHVTRRWYYFLPAHGEPRKLVHRIESAMLDALPGVKTVYSSWREQHEALRGFLQGARRVAMQHSDQCAIPYVALVDAGTVDLVRSFGPAVASSANLIQRFEAVLSDAQIATHDRAARLIDGIRAEAFALVTERLRAAHPIGEYELQQFIAGRIGAANLVNGGHDPIVGVNEHAADPHFAPSRAADRRIQAGDFLLIDLWGRCDEPDAVFYDITWTGYCGSTPPDELDRVFGIVAAARDQAVARVVAGMRAGRPPLGCEVDDAARDSIRAAGYGASFVHRTGHSITTDLHGAGAHMDNLETRDERPILPRTCFSVEPGIYLQRFGVRSEVNVITSERDARVTGEVQEQLLRLLP